MSRLLKWLLSITILGLTTAQGCSYYRHSYSIIESVPYINQSTAVCPDLISSATGLALGAGGVYTTTSADPDISIEVFSPSMSVRARPSSVFELGFRSSFSVRESEFLPYGVGDARFKLLGEPVLVIPNVGFGLGYGYVSFMWDFRTSLTLAVPLLRGQVTPYIAPKFMLFTYPYEKSGVVVLTPEWASCAMGGIDAGLGLRFPLSHTRDETQSIVLAPQVCYVMGREPRLDRVRFHLLTVGANLVYGF